MRAGTSVGAWRLHEGRRGRCSPDKEAGWTGEWASDSLSGITPKTRWNAFCAEGDALAAFTAARGTRACARARLAEERGANAFSCFAVRAVSAPMLRIAGGAFADDRDGLAVPRGRYGSDVRGVGAGVFHRRSRRGLSAVRGVRRGPLRHRTRRARRERTVRDEGEEEDDDGRSARSEDHARPVARRWKLVTVLSLYEAGFCLAFVRFAIFGM